MNHAISTKPYKGLGMEGVVAKWYASLTQKSMDEFKRLARRMAGEIPPGSDVLEVAPGPGYFSIELAKLGSYCIIGLDISKTFVKIAQRNASEAGVDVCFERGDAGGMPFEDGSFDFLFCRAAFKNFAEPEKALSEMYRVLKPGGRAYIIDLRKDASRESIAEAVHGMHLNKINTLLTQMIFGSILLKRAYTKHEFEQLLSRTNFTNVEVKEDLIGLELSLQR